MELLLLPNRFEVEAEDMALVLVELVARKLKVCFGAASESVRGQSVIYDTQADNIECSLFIR